MPFLLFTWNPLYNSKSICLSLDDATDRLDDILSLTERFYQKKGIQYEPEICEETGQVKGSHVIAFDESLHKQKKMFGRERKPTEPSEELPARESKYRRIMHADWASDNEEEQTQAELEERTSGMASSRTNGTCHGDDHVQSETITSETA